MSRNPSVAGPVAVPAPGEFLVRAILFGLLAVAGIAGVVIAGAWWASLIALAGLGFALTGVLISVLALLSDDHARAWRSSRTVAVAIAALSVAAIAMALAVG
jgi:hypothetical protein